MIGEVPSPIPRFWRRQRKRSHILIFLIRSASRPTKLLLVDTKYQLRSIEERSSKRIPDGVEDLADRYRKAMATLQKTASSQNPSPSDSASPEAATELFIEMEKRCAELIKARGELENLLPKEGPADLGRFVDLVKKQMVFVYLTRQACSHFTIFFRPPRCHETKVRSDDCTRVGKHF